MTGAEVIIKKDNLFILGKVRHDGADCLCFFNPGILFEEVETIWAEFLEFRKEKYNDPSPEWDYPPDQDPDDETEPPRYSEGFRILLLDSRNIKTWGDITNIIHTELKKSDPHHPYNCGYGDYYLFINFDRGIIQLCTNYDKTILAI